MGDVLSGHFAVVYLFVGDGIGGDFVVAFVGDVLCGDVVVVGDVSRGDFVVVYRFVVVFVGDVLPVLPAAALKRVNFPSRISMGCPDFFIFLVKIIFVAAVTINC